MQTWPVGPLLNDGNKGRGAFVVVIKTDVCGCILAGVNPLGALATNNLLVADSLGLTLVVNIMSTYLVPGGRLSQPAGLLLAS